MQAGEPQKAAGWAQSKSESLTTREINNVTLSLNLKAQELKSQGAAGRRDWYEPQNPKAREPAVLISKDMREEVGPEDGAEFTLCYGLDVFPKGHMLET